MCSPSRLLDLLSRSCCCSPPRSPKLCSLLLVLSSPRPASPSSSVASLVLHEARDEAVGRERARAEEAQSLERDEVRGSAGTIPVCIALRPPPRIHRYHLVHRADDSRPSTPVIPPSPARRTRRELSLAGEARRHRSIKMREGGGAEWGWSVSRVSNRRWRGSWWERKARERGGRGTGASRGRCAAEFRGLRLTVRGAFSATQSSRGAWGPRSACEGAIRVSCRARDEEHRGRGGEGDAP